MEYSKICVWNVSTAWSENKFWLHYSCLMCRNKNMVGTADSSSNSIFPSIKNSCIGADVCIVTFFCRLYCFNANVKTWPAIQKKEATTFFDMVLPRTTCFFRYFKNISMCRLIGVFFLAFLRLYLVQHEEPF